MAPGVEELLGVATRCGPDGEERVVAPVLERLGYQLERAKTNTGLGRATNRALAMPQSEVTAR